MRTTGSSIDRREFLASSLVAITGCYVTGCARYQQTPKRGVIVGAHPWVYAATQPQYDITPVLPQIFADMSYAGMGGVELMHTALLPDDAVERISELSRHHKL